MSQWPDVLSIPDTDHLQRLLADFWERLHRTADLLARKEMVLAEGEVAGLRTSIVEMMLSANGIAYPEGTRQLNGYLGESQRIALERTLIASGSARESIVARMVALVTIYRWYAPQLIERYGLAYPADLELQIWRSLVELLPEWPQRLDTD